jgi:hypothetical protein
MPVTTELVPFHFHGVSRSHMRVHENVVVKQKCKTVFFTILWFDTELLDLATILHL